MGQENYTVVGEGEEAEIKMSPDVENHSYLEMERLVKANEDLNDSIEEAWDKSTKAANASEWLVGKLTGALAIRNRQASENSKRALSQILAKLNSIDVTNDQGVTAVQGVVDNVVNLLAERDRPFLSIGETLAALDAVLGMHEKS